MSINQSTSLDEQICLLKIKQSQQFIVLKEHLLATGESLKPINILKSTATQVISLVKFERNILNKMIDLGVGEISKKTEGWVSKNRVGRFLARMYKYF
jgi:hypothetical protein